MSETLHEVDVAIIGSGAGGGAVASELGGLAQAGAKVVLLEAGGRFAAKDNTREEIPMAQKYYVDGGGFLTSSQDMTLAFAEAVGGSTTVYTGTSLTAPTSVFEKWAVPGIDLKDLGPRYEKYIRQNNVHLNRESELNENNLLFQRGCRELGWRVEQFPVNTKDCKGLATCNLGCARLAKQGTAVVQIPAAERAGVQVIPFCRAERIEGHDVVAEVSAPRHGLAPSSLPPGRHRFRARKIVVSAGAIGSPALLLRSPEFSGMGALGRYFTCHPALILAGIHPRKIVNTSGHPKSFFCDEFIETKRFLLETCMYFPFTLAKAASGFGRDLDELLAAYERLQMILVLTVDEALPENRVAIDRHGKPVVHYRFTDELVDSFVDAIRASAKIFFAAGAEKVHAPAARDFFVSASDQGRLDKLVTRERFALGRVSISAAHLMGGCRMGEDPATSVTDSWGRVHGSEHVYVADASLFPKPSEVNPYLTIMALADRVAEGVRRGLQ